MYAIVVLHHGVPSDVYLNNETPWRTLGGVKAMQQKLEEQNNGEYDYQILRVLRP